MIKKDKGMTLIEVSLALAILLIGVGFIMNSDTVTHRYQNQRQLRQQMMFYAAGQTEALIEGQDSVTQGTVSTPPFNNFQVDVSRTIVMQYPAAKAVLEKVTVTVSLKNSPTQPEPVQLMTYRLRAGD